MKKRIRTNGIFIFVAVAALAVFPSYFLRLEESPFLYFIEVVGFACIFLGQILRVISRGYKAEQSGQGTQLVFDGPYAMVRNPMYLGIFLIGCGVILVLFHFWVFFVFVGVFILRYLLLIFQEEKILLQHFGDRYQHYKECVPRLWPRFSFFSRHEIRAFFRLKLSWFGRELPSIIAVMLIIFIVKSWIAVVEQGWQAFWVQFFFFILMIALYIAFVNFLATQKKQRSV